MWADEPHSEQHRGGSTRRHVVMMGRGRQGGRPKAGRTPRPVRGPPRLLAWWQVAGVLPSRGRVIFPRVDGPRCVCPSSTEGRGFAEAAGSRAAADTGREHPAESPRSRSGVPGARGDATLNVLRNRHAVPGARGPPHAPLPPPRRTRAPPPPPVSSSLVALVLFTVYF